MNRSKTGVLLVNLGTPDAPYPKDVYRYLIEFLTDERVIDYPWLKRQLLVRGLIVPFRYRQSAKAYKEIWTKDGSPLMVYGNKIKGHLQSTLGEDFAVELAMRYQNPSLQSGISNLLKQNIHHLIILPLFPQYASASTGSIYQKTMDLLKKETVFPKITFINSFADHPGVIDAFCHVARKRPLEDYDHYIFSFHGLPQRQVQKADKYQHCLKSENCCSKKCQENKDCYSAQCHLTANAIIKQLQLPKQKTTVAFQSRLGKEPWLQPFTLDTIESFAKNNSKVLVFCPSFVCDCLETIYEISTEYATEFKKKGGARLDLVQGLNDEPIWINALKQLVLENAQ